MIKVKKFSKDNYLAWDSFVHNANNGTIFHLRKFLNYHSEERFKDNSIEFYKGNNLLILSLEITSSSLRSISWSCSILCNNVVAISSSNIFENLIPVFWS